MTEAGWYEDPEQHGRGRRYWDGSQWTEHYENAAPAAAPTPQVAQPAAQELPPAGWKDDPEGGPGMRYWDGKEWTDNYHPPRDGTAEQPAAASSPAAEAAPAKSSSLDETQLDVRGYQAEESAAADPTPSTPSTPVSEPVATPTPNEDDVTGRLRAIEAQLAALSEKAGIPYDKPGS